MKNWYGIWCNDDPIGWLRDRHSNGVIAFPTKRAAMNAAAKSYGFDTYTQVKKAAWCEVRPLGGKP